MRLDIYDMIMRETRSELKPWHPRVLHAAAQRNLQTGSERIGCVDAIPSKDLTVVHPRTMQNGRAVL